MTEQVPRYQEPGVGWVALVWGPLFALLGYLSELLTGGPTHWLAWLVVGAGLALFTVPWVYARRRYLTVEVTDSVLRQGAEELPLTRISEVTDVEAPPGAKVLGGGWSVPRKYEELPLRLDDDTVVLAWAKDVEALRTTLREQRGT
ncbi:DUF3093 family protein [Amycolatopsis nigrescens]|uniref:DUF3093 family protein n=1 Tax=Amycolatopsis nigrescens TaxID=381445 RepID=UPI000373F203|nr:DUF3093 family protein [Amycolatopsis nigrescens]